MFETVSLNANVWQWNGYIRCTNEVHTLVQLVRIVRIYFEAKICKKKRYRKA